MALGRDFEANMAGAKPVRIQKYSRAWVEEVFSYHAPEGVQPAQYDTLRLAARALAEIILDTCPDCADRSTALRKLREAVFTANASIALKGLI